ncbi:MAG TPA: hypothetical protein VGP46_10065, partial [Acidimicrobiales bacterium]|nr:hypothetical protein [Acidimicrobiales bacterium]
MLLAGTKASLWDLDRSLAIADDCVVTALAARSGQAWALLDGARIARIGEFAADEAASLPSADGQCLAALPNGDLLVGRTSARLTLVSGGALNDLASFDHLPGRDAWENPAAATPDLRSLAADAGGRIYANVHVGGLWSSDDWGASWM